MSVYLWISCTCQAGRIRYLSTSDAPLWKSASYHDSVNLIRVTFPCTPELPFPILTCIMRLTFPDPMIIGQWRPYAVVATPDSLRVAFYIISCVAGFVSFIWKTCFLQDYDDLSRRPISNILYVISSSRSVKKTPIVTVFFYISSLNMTFRRKLLSSVTLCRVNVRYVRWRIFVTTIT